MNKCNICKNEMVETHIQDLFLCNYCFFVENLRIDYNFENSGIVYNIKKTNNKNFIWFDLLHLLNDPNVLFEILKEITTDDYNNIIFIKIESLNGDINNHNLKQYNSYLNINCIKLLCELHKFNIVELYKIDKNNEIFYICEIKKHNEEYSNHNSILYEYMYKEMIDNIYDLVNYI